MYEVRILPQFEYMKTAISPVVYEMDSLWACAKEVVKPKHRKKRIYIYREGTKIFDSPTGWLFENLTQEESNIIQQVKKIREMKKEWRK